ncbi:hypothetical protein PYW07_007823 [Mythimna separata]|uniref:Uncharacterized protein n=1 Tax=Mythimna separata TaxID=271217 RepID=A0AAD8DV93_MYTSE|nr:hypothetical protein PYW07_007823 [Mythimna separata]
MYSNMCVKIALCVALIVSIDGFVLKHQALPLSPEGMTVEITVRGKEDPRHPLFTTRLDIDEKKKTVVIATAEASSGDKKPRVVAMSSLGDRHGINLGTCPEGYVGRAGFCFPSDDA